ncbi:MAG: hypothetical protein IKS31_07890 [Clostridia bacterium]|nr:hypothetical protein [Clostridia bacterium]
MRKKLSLLFCLLAAAMMLTSCALVKKDNSLTVLTVNGKTHTLGEISSLLEKNLSSLLSQYNEKRQEAKESVVSADDADFLAFARGEVKQQVVEQDITKEMIASYDAALTEDEIKQVNDAYDAYVTEYLKEWDIAYAENEDLIKMLVDAGYDQTSLSNMLANNVIAKIGEPPKTADEKQTEALVKAMAVKDGVTVSDEELQEEYTAHLESDKTAYTDKPSDWADAKNSGSILTYAPAGLRMVHQILVRFSEDEQKALSDLEGKITEIKGQIDALTPAPSTAEAGTAEEAPAATAEAPVKEEEAPAATAEAPAKEEEVPAVTAEAPAEAAQTAEAPAGTVEANDLEGLKKQLTALEGERDAMWAKLSEKAGSVVEKARSGEDWAELTKEYNSDPGMTEGRETAKTGYAVCEGFTSFDPDFVKAAMGLENIGDITEPIRSDGYNGFYIIRYTADVEEGDIPLENVKDALHDHLYEEKCESHYQDVMKKALDEASVSFDENLLKR